MAESASVKWQTARPWLGTLIRLVLGVVWLWAAIPKLASPREFVQAVWAYDATPEWLSQAIGYGLPVLEFSLGVVLIFGVVVRLAAAVSGVLFAVFLVGIIQAAARGIELACGCFGGGGTTTGGTSYTLDILRDIGLLVLAAFLVVWPMTRLSIDEFVTRNDRVAQPSAKRMRTDQGRKKYNALLEQRRKEARTRERWLGASLAAVIVLVSLIGIGVQSGRAKIEGSLTATNASATTGVTVGKKTAPAKVVLYEDLQCPVCANYERTVGPTLDKLVAAGKAQVQYHVISLPNLDSDENGKYSSKGGNAAYCASDVSTSFFTKFLEYSYRSNVQPGEGAGGLSDTKIVANATAAGLPAAKKTDFTSCVTDEKHAVIVEALTDKSSQDGVNGTPTVRVNGKTIENTAAALTKAVNASTT